MVRSFDGQTYKYLHQIERIMKRHHNIEQRMNSLVENVRFKLGEGNHNV